MRRAPTRSCSGRGPGYLDSLAGLVFFLLCGRVFQQKTYDRMAFDRDYKCFFPLSVTRKTAAGEESMAHFQLAGGGPAAVAERGADSRRCAAGERAGVH